MKTISYKNKVSPFNLFVRKFVQFAVFILILQPMTGSNKAIWLSSSKQLTIDALIDELSSLRVRFLKIETLFFMKCIEISSRMQEIEIGYKKNNEKLYISEQVC